MAAGAMIWIALGAIVPGSATGLTNARGDAAPKARLQVAQTNADSNTRQQLLEQKVALITSYLNSTITRRIAEGNDAAAKTLVARAEMLLEQARDALAAENNKSAEQSLDEALRSLSTASQTASRDNRVENDARARMRYQRLRRNIESYTKPTSKMAASTGTNVLFPNAGVRIDALMAQAKESASTGHYREANRILAKVYRIVVTEIAESSRGETVISHLRFSGPKDEFEYERRRNESYEMLIELMLSDSPDTGKKSLAELVGPFVARSRSFRRQANDAATEGDYETAIRTIEEATRHLTRALRAGGLFVPE